MHSFVIFAQYMIQNYKIKWNIYLNMTQDLNRIFRAVYNLRNWWFQTNLILLSGMSCFKRKCPRDSSLLSIFPKCIWEAKLLNSIKRIPANNNNRVKKFWHTCPDIDGKICWLCTELRRDKLVSIVVSCLWSVSLSDVASEPGVRIRY